jgi:nucleoside-diphosphate-sugar epimerase
MNKKILVTGGTGFVGVNLVRELLKRKERVTVFSLAESHPLLDGMKVKMIIGDVRDKKAVENSLKGVEYVYHLAASSLNTKEKWQEIFDVNVRGTKNVLECSLKAKVKKVVYVGSAATLGFSAKVTPLGEDKSIDFKDNLYEQSKKIAENEVEAFITKGGSASIALPGFVIGAGEVDPARYGLWKSIDKNRIKFTYPGGSGVVAVKDLVSGLMLVMKKGKSGERYALSSEYVSLYDLYNCVAKTMGKKTIRWKIPSAMYFPMYLFGFALEKIMRSPPLTREAVRWHFNHKWVDGSKAKKELGWDPKISLNEAIEETLRYYESRKILR